MNLDQFFWLARERYAILERRRAGAPKPWTDDDILRQFKFCNVFREDDATTIWIKENIRDPLRSDKTVLAAMMISRYFNRISTLERLKPMLLEKRWDSEEARSLIQDCKPLITAAYMVRSPQGMDKLTGMLWSIDQSYKSMVAKGDQLLKGQDTIESVTDWLARLSSLGDFMAYEIATDLVHTDMLEKAPDRMTWANPGPGCLRGLSWLKYDEDERTVPRIEAINDMRAILKASQDPENWPAELPKWEIREVEHVLCEYDKYIRTTKGVGTPKQTYDGGGPKTIEYGQFGRRDTRPSSGSSGPRTPRDPIEDMVNRKMEARERELNDQVAALVETIISTAMQPYEKQIAALPEDFLPVAERVSLSSAVWDGPSILLKSPRRIPAFLAERPIDVPDEMQSDLAKFREMRNGLGEEREKLKAQIRELLA